MVPVVVSYYSKGTPYENEIHTLEDTLKLFAPDIKTDIQGVLNWGSWDANTHFKPTFIRRMVEKHQQGVLYLDSDSVLVRRPEEFYKIEEKMDFGCCFFNWGGRVELSGAVLYFNNSEVSIKVLKLWEEACRKFPTRFDQHLLHKIILGVSFQVKSFVFAKEYDVIFDLHKEIQEPVIKQMQASRRFKELIPDLFYHSSRDTHEDLVRDVHTGQSAIIIGKGQSVESLGPLDRYHSITIGINDIGKKFPQLDYLFYFDAITGQENEALFEKMHQGGTRIFTPVGRLNNFYYKLFQQDSPYGWEPGKFFHSFTSAYWCLQLAYWMGCREIYLAGVDLRMPDKTEGAYYDGSSAREGLAYENHMNKMRPGFIIAAAKMEEYGFKVYRISEFSSLDCFEVKLPV